MKIAVTALLPSMISVHVVSVPTHAPSQPAKTWLPEVCAVSVTTVPTLNDALQVVPQSMPAGLLVTRPP